MTSGKSRASMALCRLEQVDAWVMALAMLPSSGNEEHGSFSLNNGPQWWIRRGRKSDFLGQYPCMQTSRTAEPRRATMSARTPWSQARWIKGWATMLVARLLLSSLLMLVVAYTLPGDPTCPIMAQPFAL